MRIRIYLGNTGNKSLRGSRFLLATLNCSVARCGNPAWRAVCPHTQNSISDDRVVDLLRGIYPLPAPIKAIQPYHMESSRTVVVNV